jgi:integrase
MARFFAHLRQQDSAGAKALAFAILTAARSGEVRAATWEEIDLANGVWTVPAERMKAGKEHRVALSPLAIELLDGLPQPRTGMLFPAPRAGELSDATLKAVIMRMHEANTSSGQPGYLDPKRDKLVTPHGFRSTFRDWAAEHTNHPREVAEMALAHTIESKVEAAYRRGDLFEKRRALMADWAGFCFPKK